MSWYHSCAVPPRKMPPSSTVAASQSEVAARLPWSSADTAKWTVALEENRQMLVKMADCAAMRQAMPTMPRAGSTQGSVAVCGMTAAVLKAVRLQLFVMAVRIEGMLEV